MSINKRKILQSAQKYLQKGALDKALKYVGPEHLIYGSDNTAPGDLAGYVKPGREKRGHEHDEDDHDRDPRK